MNKKLGTGFVVVAIVAVTLFAGCIDELPLPTPTQMPSPTPTHIVTPTPTPSQYPVPDGNQSNVEEQLRIGAFNIQVFGKSKASKPEVMDVLGKIIRTYDVVAIEEIRDKSQTALPVLVDTVNSDSSQFDYILSFRVV